MGECIFCGNRLSGMQTKFCSKNCNRRYHKKRAEWNNLCNMCYEPMDDTTTKKCEDCHEKHRKSNRELRQRWKDEGKCTRCGKERCKGCSGIEEWR